MAGSCMRQGHLLTCRNKAGICSQAAANCHQSYSVFFKEYRQQKHKNSRQDQTGFPDAKTRRV
jgi:hypothetical protein